MPNTYELLCDEIGSEDCLGIVFAADGDGWWRDETAAGIAQCIARFPWLAADANRLYTLTEAHAFLDVSVDCGFGSRELPALYCWTPTRVIFTGQYDGASWFTSVPREPTTKVIPQAVGGG